MSLWKVAWRSIQQRALPSALTALSMGLGVALVVAVLVIHGVVYKSFQRGSQGYDLIVGAKGGQLQLVLNTVFHLGTPLENIPYEYFEEFSIGNWSPLVDIAVPVCMGHAYEGFPVVATNPDMFNELTYLEDQEYEFADGANFEETDIHGAVLGGDAARKTGLKVGDTFEPVGQTADGSAGHKDEPFVVRGILKHTGTPNDSAIFVNIEGFFLCPTHTKAAASAKKMLQQAVPKDKEGDAKAAPPEDPAGEKKHESEEDVGNPHAGHDHGHHKEVTAILVRTNKDNYLLAMNLPEVINEGKVAQAVQPTREITRFFDTVVGNIQLMLLVLAVLVVIVAGIGIMVSIYNSMSDRRHEIAVMRALGANRSIVMVVILMESILLSLGGGLFGELLGHGLIGALGPTIYRETGVIVSAFEFQTIELILIPGLIILATIVGYLPAVAAYQTDVAKSLTNTQ